MSVSIIIPAYNAAPWLSDALGSISLQTFRDWEAIVVDDCSTDGTADVVEDFRTKDDRVRLLKLNRNCGPATARNRGMLEARGEYLAFLDADDIWLPRKLEKQLHQLETRPDCYACYTQFEVVDDRLRRLQGWHELGRTFSHNPVNAYALARGNYVGGSASGVFMRRSVLQTVGFFNETMSGSEDFDYWYRIALVGEFCLVQEVLVQIRRRSATRLSSAVRNLSGSLDFVNNARLIAPAEHRRMLRELELQTRMILWALNIVSKGALRKTNLTELILLGRQNQILKSLVNSIIKLGGLTGLQSVSEERRLQGQG